MAPLKFDKLLCGPSLDLFTKDFPHGNVWEVEHVAKGPKLELNNSVLLSKAEKLSGVATVKHNVFNFDTELKLNSAGVHSFDVFGHSPFCPKLKVGSRYTHDGAKNKHSLLVTSEHVSDLVSSRAEVSPLALSYNVFSLFHFGPAKNCTVGAEVVGKKLEKINFTLGTSYKRVLEGNTFLFALRLAGSCDQLVEKVLGNAHVTNEGLKAPTSLSVAFDHSVKEGTTALSFGGLWHLTPLDHPLGSFLKAKCDNNARVSVAYGQKLNGTVGLVFGVDFDAKKLASEPDLKYGDRKSVV